VSVVTAAARRRWAVVVAGTALLVAAPSLAVAGVSVATRPASVPAPQTLVRRALASASVAHQGLAESRGTLGLPDVQQFGDVAALLGSTTRERVWWQDADHWRVARLLTTGEQDVYSRSPNTVVTWDYERNLRRRTFGTGSVRLPRVDDLVPPQAARRLLGALDPADRVTPLPARVIGGLQGAGLRVVPASHVGTIGSLDVWIEPGSGLPLALTVRDRHGATAFETAFLDVDVAEPAAPDLAVPRAPGARRENADAPDLVALVDRYTREPLPSTLAGQPRTPGVIRGTATYGQGLARFVVVPLPPGPAIDVLDAARLRAPAETVTGGQTVTLDAGVVTATVAVGDGERSYLVTGMVTADVVRAAGQDLLARDPS
jgi:hypothetical protein